MNNEELLRYVRMKREKEMGIILNDDENAFLNKIDMVANSDAEIKSQINMLLNSTSLRNAYNILDGNVEISNEISSMKEVDETMMSSQTKNSNIIDDTMIKTPEQEDGGRQFTKKAGFVDVLILSLITGFIGGVTTTIIFMMI